MQTKKCVIKKSEVQENCNMIMLYCGKVTVMSIFYPPIHICRQMPWQGNNGQKKEMKQNFISKVNCNSINKCGSWWFVTYAARKLWCWSFLHTEVEKYFPHFNTCVRVNGSMLCNNPVYSRHGNMQLNTGHEHD